MNQQDSHLEFETHTDAISEVFNVLFKNGINFARLVNFSDEDDSGYIKKDFFQTTLLNQLKGISKQMIYSFVETLFQNNQSISSKSLKQNMSDLFKSSSPSTSLSIPQIPPKK